MSPAGSALDVSNLDGPGNGWLTGLRLTGRRAARRQATTRWVAGPLEALLKGQLPARRMRPAWPSPSAEPGLGMGRRGRRSDRQPRQRPGQAGQAMGLEEGVRDAPSSSNRSGRAPGRRARAAVTPRTATVRTAQASCSSDPGVPARPARTRSVAVTRRATPTPIRSRSRPSRTGPERQASPARTRRPWRRPARRP